MSNYATKFAKKADLANLKSDVDDLDIDKSKIVPVDLNKLNNVVKNVVIKRLYMINWSKKLKLFTLMILAF